MVFADDRIDDLKGPGLRAFFKIAGFWNLDEAEQMSILGLKSPSILQALQAGDVEQCSADVLERISYVLGIYKGVHSIFTQQDQADGWMRRPNKAPIFGGKSAVDRMVMGGIDDLRLVRNYLDAMCN